MRKLLAILIVLFSISTLHAQNTVRNFTPDSELTQQVKRGLEILDIDSTTVTLVPMKKYYQAVARASNGKPWGATVMATPRVFTVIFSNRHDAEFEFNRYQRLAHELIHVWQGYNQIKCEDKCEKQAYKKQYKLAEQLRNITS